MNDQCSFHFLGHSMKGDKGYVKRVISVVLNVDFVTKNGPGSR